MAGKDLLTARNIYIMILILSVLCFGVSTIITLEKDNTQNIGAVCSAIGGPSKCVDVQNSQYGKIFGIDNAIYGMVGFALMMILSILLLSKPSMQVKVLLIAGSFIGGLLSLWFLYAQAILLKAFCSLCLTVDIMSVLVLILGIILLLKKR